MRTTIILLVSIILLAWSTPYPSLIGHWKLNEGGGKLARNSVLTNVNGDLTNGALFSNMQKGNCVYLDGVNDYVNIPDVDQYSFGNGSTDKPFTITAWVYNQNTSGQNFRLASKFTSGIGSEWFVGTRPTGAYLIAIYTLSASGSVLAEATGSNAANDVNLWTFLAFTYDASKAYTGIRIYRNGIAYPTYTSLGSGTYTGMSNTNEPVRIGNLTTTYAKGYIQDFKIFNRELNATEIKNMYVESYNRIFTNKKE